MQPSEPKSQQPTANRQMRLSQTCAMVQMGGLALPTGAKLAKPWGARGGLHKTTQRLRQDGQVDRRALLSHLLAGTTLVNIRGGDSRLRRACYCQCYTRIVDSLFRVLCNVTGHWSVIEGDRGENNAFGPAGLGLVCPDSQDPAPHLQTSVFRGSSQGFRDPPGPTRHASGPATTS